MILICVWEDVKTDKVIDGVVASYRPRCQQYHTYATAPDLASVFEHRHDFRGSNLYRQYHR
jgi:hypothetical protein